MKKIRTILALTLISNSLFLVSCSDQETPEVNNRSNTKVFVSGLDSNQVGEFHNGILEYIETNWDESLVDENDFVASISLQQADMMKDYMEKDVFTSSKITINDESVYYEAASTINEMCRKELEHNFGSKSSDAYEMQPIIFKKLKEKNLELITDLSNEGLVTAKEKDFLVNALDEFDAIETNRNYSDYPALISNLRKAYDEQDFDADKHEGVLSSILIDVAGHSHDYWTITFPVVNPNPGYQTFAVPLWVAADAVGALAGAGSSLWSQRNKKDTDWWDVGGQAVIWGASTSLLSSPRFTGLFKAK
jgi:hypothetical protein